MRGRIFFAAILVCSSGTAFADEQSICADRPGKANPSCTVPTGKWQIEVGLIDWSQDHIDGARTDSVTLGAAAVKYGLSDRWHLELDLPPYDWQRVRAGGFRQHGEGIGDLVVRSKYRLTVANGVQVAVEPFLKIPTARHSIGNGKVEAGVAIPVDYSIPDSPLSITLGPEVDWIADADERGHHAAMAQVIGLGWQATRKLDFSAELWGQWNWDPAGTIRQRTADAAIAYLVNNNLQLDAGANFGLNRQTPDIELYSGMSMRF